MTTRSAIFLAVLVIASLTTLTIAGDTFSPALTTQYLGQKPPGTISELFAPELFNAEHGYHSPVVFNSAFTEAVWTPMKQAGSFEYSQIIGGHWSLPIEMSFGFEHGTGDPAFWPAGSRIYFTSFQPPYAGAPVAERIWYAKRDKNGWSAPQLIDSTVLAHPTHWTFSFADNRNLYFTSEIAGVRGEQDIYMARFDGEHYLEPVGLGDAINSDGKDLAPFIARDESYLFFTRVGRETRKADLYISFRDADGNWAEAISFGDDINSAANDLGASVSPDGKYMFYISQKNGMMNRMYWVDASNIDSVKQRLQ